MFGRDPINKLNMLLHAARRYFHDDNGLPNLEALKNIYQVVAQQLLNSRERYVKKHHNKLRLQRQHLNGTHHRCEEDYTEGTGC